MKRERDPVGGNACFAETVAHAVGVVDAERTQRAAGLLIVVGDGAGERVRADLVASGYGDGGVSGGIAVREGLQVVVDIRDDQRVDGLK